MHFIEVKNKEDIRAFHQIPKIIYQKDSNWIPHIENDIEKVFDPGKNKLFNDGKAIRWIVRNEKNELIGRIAAFVNTKTAYTFEQPTGGIGFFECINNQDVANALFDKAKNWLIKQGMEAMDGPINFGEKNQFWGLLIENFTDMNSYGMNYNPAYYKLLFENYGFQVYYEQYCYKRDLYIPAQPIFVRKYNQMNANPDFKITNIRGMSLERVAEDFRAVYNGAWGGHDGFKPMTSEAAQKIMKALKPIVDIDIIVFVYHKNTPIAFYVNIPELNEIFRFVNGKLNLIGKLKFLYHKWRKTPRTMVGIVFGVVKEFQGQGIEGAMIKWSEDHIVSLKRYDETVLTWIGDFNPKMLKVCENLGASRYRTLATYRYLFDRNKKFERCPIID
ncbi:MAG: hypothetical protein ACK4K0_09980 [Flavobacteriales bacterium]